MFTTDPLADRILGFLADRYLPVQTDWIETPQIAAALDVKAENVDARCRSLAALGLIELSAPDEEHATYAALITTKGLLGIGRVP